MSLTTLVVEYTTQWPNRYIGEGEKQKSGDDGENIKMWRVLLDLRLRLEIVTRHNIIEVLFRYFIELQLSWHIMHEKIIRQQQSCDIKKRKLLIQ